MRTEGHDGDGNRVDGPSRPPDETSDYPSGMILQPALRARGKYVSKSDMVTTHSEN
jgi:hypothetical protein